MKRFLFVVAATFFLNGCVIVVPRETLEDETTEAHKSKPKKHKRHKRTNVSEENAATDRLLDKDQRPYYVALRAGK